MADAEAKAKAEKIAAAKKRVEQLKKNKAKKTGGASAKADATAEKEPDVEVDKDKEKEKTDGSPEEGKEKDEEVEKEKEKGENAVAAKEEVPEPQSTTPQRQPSLSQQSKMRSSSFRQSISLSGPLSPSLGGGGEDTAPEIYRKQAARIEELEKENKRLAKEASEGEKRYKKAEEELEVLREGEGESKENVPAAAPSSSEGDEVKNLKTQVAALERQNAQLQAQVSRPTRHATSPSSAGNIPLSSEDLSAELASKSTTIESMEIEISNLRAQLARSASGTSLEKEQIAALEDKLVRTEKLLDTSQRELQDLKKNLERTTEKAVKEGSERTSAETKLRTLSKEAEEAQSKAEELQKKVDALEKKVTTLTTLHKEHDARSQTLKREREKVDKEATELRSRLAAVENENLRLREEKDRLKARHAEGVDDDGVDELENEERQRLEQKVRQLEAEIFELRRGAWRDRRREIDGDFADSAVSGPGDGITSPGSKFTEIDLSGGGGSPSARRRSGAAGAGKGLSDLFASSFGAFVGNNNTHHGATSLGGAADALLEGHDDEDADFDEEAFRQAQEEEARKRIERVKEVKRKLNDWKGWRLDIVEARSGGGEGAGPIFEV